LTKVKAAVLGATGYAGFELSRLLMRHPRVADVAYLTREDGAVHSLDAVYPHVGGNGALPLEPFSWKTLEAHGTQLLFLATPHELSRELVPEALDRGLRIVDLSGAWRLKRAENRAVYGFVDREAAVAAELDASAVFGLPELHRDQIAKAKLVANPGCYATSVICGLTPIVKAGIVDTGRGIVCDAKSGVSGAGKKATARTHFCEVADNLSAYSVFGHRHTGEILEQVGLSATDLIFTPHLLPIPRGILSTMYVRLRTKSTAADVEKVYRKFYEGAKWVRVYPAGKLPEIQYSVRTNYCDVGFVLAENGMQLIVVSCLDNLLKGAAGQAVQNMNVMYGWNEQEGLQ
jgi:N-acetyl-gamma-glutamyl-phosphate reductase